MFFSCSAQISSQCDFSKESWKEVWSSSQPVQAAEQGIRGGTAGKASRLTSKKMLDVKPGDVVQLRLYFQGGSINCGVIGFDRNGKTCHFASSNLAPVPGIPLTNASFYYTVPEKVSRIRLFADVKETTQLARAFWKTVVKTEQPNYFYTLSDKELIGSFHSGEGMELPRNYTSMWNSGKLEVIHEKFASYTKCLRITADGKKDAGIRFNIPFPVKKGDCIVAETIFRGTGSARIGIFGSSLFKSSSIPIRDRNWDKRQELFEVTSDKCTKIYAFLAAPKGHTVDYVYIRIAKLENDPRLSFLPDRLAQKWRTLTAGNNLALGKKVTAFPSRTKSTSLLTDGKIFLTTDLVFSKGALVWKGAMTEKQVRLIVDLGQVRKVGKAGIRISGGKQVMRFPRMLKIYVSKDGKKYYPAAALAKVSPAEADLADFQNLYYLDDKDPKGVSFTYPFVLNVNAEARYVAFLVNSDSYYSLISDELAVIEASGKTGSQWNLAYQNAPDPYFCHEAVRIEPYTDKFYIAEDIFLPNLFAFDMRLQKNDEKFTYTIDLPAETEISPYRGWPPKAINLTKTDRNGSRAVFHFAPNYTLGRMRQFSDIYYNGPFLFRIPAGKTVPEKERYAAITAVCSAGRITTRYPLEILKFGKVPSYKRLKLGMMIHSRFLTDWPEFVRAWKVIGFNMLQFETSPNQISPNMCRKIVEETDRYGIYRRAFSNPICDMCFGSRKDKAELRCTSAVLPGKKWIAQLDFCPSYRGQYYKELLENIRKMVVMCKPHAIEFDDEAWNPKQLNFIPDCTRCMALRKEKNLTLAPFIEWAQADFLTGYYHAVKEGAKQAGIPMPDITHWPFNPVSGNYFCRGEKVMNHGFPLLFPKYANLATYFYYAQSVAEQQEGIRKVLETVKDPKKLAMTVHGGIGCYRTGYMGKKTKHLFIDSVVNGTTHVVQYGTFSSPHDYYQMNEAIRLLVPYEDILMDGALDRSFTGTNKQLLYTRRTLGKRSLLLIGNYSNRTANETELSIRGKVFNCVTGKRSVADGSYKLRIAPDDFAMLLLEE